MDALRAHLQFWEGFCLSEFHSELDSFATAIAVRQDDSEASRKRLVEKSKEFKKTSTEEVRHQVAPLLKAFQAEVDALTKRSKATETALLTAYKKLIDLPDPVPILNQAILTQQKLQKAQDCEIENRQLRETLEEYNVEFAQVKNQDVTINKLREQITATENKMESVVEERTKSREIELVTAFEERSRQLEVAREEVDARVNQAEAKVITMRQALEATQTELIELKNKVDDDATARASEIELLMTDLERANQRSELAERELAALKEENTISRHSSNALVHQEELEAQLTAKDKEILALIETNQKLQKEMSSLKDVHTKEISVYEAKVREKALQVETLEERLLAQKDYEEVKNELQIIKSVEFGGQVKSSESVKAESSSKSLEVLLLEKSRDLQNEATSFKMENVELKRQLTQVREELTGAQRTVSHQQAMITKLESDLLQVQPLLSTLGTSDTSTANPPSLAPSIMADAVRDATLLSSESKPSPSLSVMTEMRQSSGSTAESLLPIVSSQRERFKQKNAELEAECHHQKDTISHLKHETDRLRTDNVKLYEKIKFLQSYPTTSKPQEKFEDETTGKYSIQYEERLDPFSTFNQQERKTRYNKLSGPEKATLSLAKMILTNKVARTIAFFYTIFLHVLILLMLIKLASAVDCSRDMSSEWALKALMIRTSCPGSNHKCHFFPVFPLILFIIARYLQHMQLAHGENFGPDTSTTGQLIQPDGLTEMRQT